jgi:hypothetical protein
LTLQPNDVLQHAARPDHNPSCSGARIMADSDNTMTLPFVTWGRKMGGTS